MKLKFVADEEIKRTYRRKSAAIDFTPFIEELYKHPNKWAEYPDKINNSTQAYRIRKQFNDIEVIITGGNNLAAGNPDKKLWTLYIRYTPSEVIDDGTF